MADSGASRPKTVLGALHDELGAKFGEFAGYDMPLTFDGLGAAAEHLHTRAKASLFDVSHMGVVDLHGDDVGAALEQLVPGGITTLEPGRSRYTFFTNDRGGVLDDLIITRLADRFMAVVNASRRDHDIAHLQTLDGVEVQPRTDLHVIALQGPAAEAVLTDSGLAAGVDLSSMAFMEAIEVDGLRITRSGYTGEDGFELAATNDRAVEVARGLLGHDDVQPAGLVARDTLRLEAGLCLYGNDLTEDTTPVEAGLVWAMPRRRREAGDFPGGAVITRQLAEGPTRVRVGIATDQRRPIRPGNPLEIEGQTVGEVTSGGFGPSADAPVAMGYLDAAHGTVGTDLMALVRSHEVPCRVAELPFVAHRYRR